MEREGTWFAEMFAGIIAPTLNLRRTEYKDEAGNMPAPVSNSRSNEIY